MQVLYLCAELELDRSELLTWLKRNGKGGARPPPRAPGAPPPAPKPAPPARAAASDDSPFAAVPAGRPVRGARDSSAAAGDKAAAAAPKRLSKEAFHAKLPSNVPYWKSFTKPRLGRHQTDTLERVYQNNRFPTVRASVAQPLLIARACSRISPSNSHCYHCRMR
jgi:hypothetical protein